MAAEPVSAMDVAADGWELAWKTIISLPRLFIRGLLVLALWQFVLSYSDFIPRQYTSVAIENHLENLLNKAIYALVFASIAIAVHRFVMLDEIFDRPVWRVPVSYARFVVWLFILDVVSTLPSDVVVQRSPWFMWVNFVYEICFWFASLRLLLLFPAIAIASPHAGWRNAWSDSRGHVWKFFWATFWVILPVMIVLFVALLVIGQITDLRIFISKFSEAFALCAIAGSLLVLAVAAAVASRFFQLYGNSLVQATGPSAPFAPSP